jgi:hypothetical protein
MEENFIGSQSPQRTVVLEKKKKKKKKRVSEVNIKTFENPEAITKRTRHNYYAMHTFPNLSPQGRICCSCL